MNELTKNEEYKALLEEVDAIFSTKGFEAREAVIEGYYLVGERITKYAKERDEKFVHALVKQVAKEIKRSPRAMYQGVQFYNHVTEKFGTLQGWWDKQDMRVSWHDVANKLLSTRSRELPDCTHEWVLMCKKCHQPKAN